MDERSRVQGLARDEGERIEALKAKLSALDAQRIDAIAEARLQPDPAQSTAGADKLLGECAKLRQEIADADGVSVRMTNRVTEISQAIDALKIPYRCDLGAFLCGLQGQLIARYNERAPGVAEVVLQIAALHRVMMLYQAGNSNGWDGSIRLPGMKAGEGNYIAPMLDAGSDRFGSEANDRMAGILDELRAAGFIWRFD
jgi:hypothetical protein